MLTDHATPADQAAVGDSGAIIVLTGPPGAGKTTTATLVADRLSPSVHLHCDDFWRFIRRGGIAPYLPESHRQNEVVMNVLVSAADGYATGGYQVIVDGIVGPWFIGLFQSASRARAIPLYYIVLRPGKTTALRRAADRAGDALSDPLPVEHMYRQFADVAEFERHVIDTTALTPGQTADAVLATIADGSHLLS